MRFKRLVSSKFGPSRWRKKQLILLLLLGGLATVVLLVGVDARVKKQAKDRLYTDADLTPETPAGLLLGTSKRLSSGQPNPYFVYRIDAAEQLYKAGKIQRLVISGDNSRASYNEPLDMQLALQERGIPPEHLYLDYAGFRTFDSVYRMRAIFGQTRFVVISQPFHNERALFIAKRLGLEAIGFNAQDVSAVHGLKTQLREKFARVKMLLDFVFHRQPKFLGDPVPIDFGEGADLQMKS